MSAEKFLAFFLSAGVISSAGSRIFQTIAMHSYKSLGASGDIFCIYVVVIFFNLQTRRVFKTFL